MAQKSRGLPIHPHSNSRRKSFKKISEMRVKFTKIQQQKSDMIYNLFIYSICFYPRRHIPHAAFFIKFLSHLKISRLIPPGLPGLKQNLHASDLPFLINQEITLFFHLFQSFLMPLPIFLKKFLTFLNHLRLSTSPASDSSVPSARRSG